MIKAILYERTVALCASMDLGKVWEDLSYEVTAVCLGGAGDYEDMNPYSEHFGKNWHDAHSPQIVSSDSSLSI